MKSCWYGKGVRVPGTDRGSRPRAMLESCGDSFSDDSVEDRRATIHLRHVSLYPEKLERVMVISQGEDPNLQGRICTGNGW